MYYLTHLHKSRASSTEKSKTSFFEFCIESSSETGPFVKLNIPSKASDASFSVAPAMAITGLPALRAWSATAFAGNNQIGPSHVLFKIQCGKNKISAGHNPGIEISQ